MTKDEFLYALHCWLIDEVRISDWQMADVRANTRLTPTAVGLGEGINMWQWATRNYARMLARLILGPDAKSYSVTMLAKRIIDWQASVKVQYK